MASFGDYYNKSKKKLSKEELAKKAGRAVSTWTLPQPEVIKKGKREKSV